MPSFFMVEPVYLSIENSLLLQDAWKNNFSLNVEPNFIDDASFDDY